VPKNWHKFCDQITDNFRVINPSDFRVLKWTEYRSHKILYLDETQDIAIAAEKCWGGGAVLLDENLTHLRLNKEEKKQLLASILRPLQNPKIISWFDTGNLGVSDDLSFRVLKWTEYIRAQQEFLTKDPEYLGKIIKAIADRHRSFTFRWDEKRQKYKKI